MVVKQRGGPPLKNAQNPGFASDCERFREIASDCERNQESPFLLINRYYDWTKPEYQVGGHTDYKKNRQKIVKIPLDSV